LSAQNKIFFSLQGISVINRSPFFVFVFLICFQLAAAATFEFNSECRIAYTKIFNLQFNAARSIMQEEKNRNPDNAALALLENDIDFLSAYITEERPHYKKMLANLEQQINSVEKVDIHSPYRMYALADIHLHSGFVKLKFGDYLSGALDFYKANSLLKKNQKLFPAFILNLKGIGTLHAMAGVVPSEYKWLTSVAGFEGNIVQGLSELDSLFRNANSEELNFVKPEVALLLFYLKNNFENVEDERTITKLFTDTVLLKNPLIAFGYSGYIMRNGKTEESIKILESASMPADIPFLLLEYRLGYAKMCKGDKDAINHLLKFASSFKGKNYLRSCFRYVAWHYLLTGDEIKYRQFIGDVLFVGAAAIGEDKDATREAAEKKVPDKNLLRARLFFDGGYFSKADEELKRVDVLKNKVDSVEFLYRRARILHALSDTSNAINLYQRTFTQGKLLGNYFAANSALQLGLIYERKQKRTEAREWFNKCINLSAYDYKASIERKAKAGLERMK
jgi:tetratricopeptide (TPR) repeat protein